jgi:oligopeptidase A
MALNPLLNMHNNLPTFTDILPEHVKPALEYIIEKYKKTLTDILNEHNVYTWNNLIVPLDDLDEEYHNIISPVSHMCSVVNTTEMQKAYDDTIEMRSEFGIWINQHIGLYDAIYQLIDDSELISKQRQHILTLWDKSYRTSGINLNTNDQDKLNKISTELSKSVSEFNKNSLSGTECWSITITDESRLKGIPSFAIATAKEEANHRKLNGWVFTLMASSVNPILTYAEDRSLREEIYNAYITVASDAGPSAGKWDNSKIVEDIVKFKTEKSKLLNFNNYCELSLYSKMVETPEQINKFLNDMVERCKDKALVEFENIKEVSVDLDGITELQPWDTGYYSNKLKEQSFSFDENEVRSYLQCNNVLTCMMDVASKLYGITFKQEMTNSTKDTIGSRDTGAVVSTWHDSVLFYSVYDEYGHKIASFYLDLFARVGKRGGAWMDDAVSRRKLHNGLIRLPVAYLNCNFNAPTKKIPSLLSMRDVETVFHEFGHGLHHMLTTIDYSPISGINNVPWDAVELPSQFMEHFCWDKNTLISMSEHYITKKKMPVKLVEKVIKSKNFGSGMGLLNQLELSIFDLRVYGNYDGSESFIKDTFMNTKKEIAIMPVKDYNRFFTSFNHIFAGGYSAGYFSYIWAEALSSEVFAVFENSGDIFDKSTGLSFLSSVLSKGGSDDFMTMFKSFTNSEPQIDNLLRHKGLN